MNSLKKILMLMFLLSFLIPIMATTVTIGTGTTVQRQPIACWYGYERSADLYLASEIGMTGNISDLAWFSSITQTLATPTKIYLKTTTATTTVADNWANLITGATLVFDGTVTGATASSWKLVDINDYVYTSGNLLVLVECTYGGSGTGGMTGTQWAYTTTATNLASEVHQDNSAPTSNVTLNLNRPNIQMNITPLSGPAVFNMNPTMINYGTTFLNITTAPTTVYVSNIGGTSMHINSSVLGGANASGFIVNDTNTYPLTLASGSSINFTVAFRPTVGQTYNATITVTDDLAGRTAHVLTLTGLGFDSTISSFPYSESFDGTLFPPLGWTNQRIVGTATPGLWQSATTGASPTCAPHSGAAMAYYNSYSIGANTHTVLSTPSLTLPGNNYRISFWFYRDASGSYNVPRYGDEGVSVWFGTSPTDTTLAVNLGFMPRDVVFAPTVAAAGWYKYAFNFPAASAGSGKFVILKAKSQYGDNMFLDDVTIETQPTGAPLPAMLLSPANAAANLFPATTLNWLPDGSGPAATGFRLSLGTNNPPTNLLNNIDIGMVTTYTPTLQYGNTYYWQLVPYNALGNATGCPIWSFSIMADPTISTFPFTETFDGGVFPPNGWANVRIQGTSLGTWDAQTAGTSPTCTPHSGTAMTRFNSFSYSRGTQGALISPPIVLPTSTYRVKFWMYRDDGYPDPAYDNEMVSVWLSSTQTLTGADSLGAIHRRSNLFPVEAANGWYVYAMSFPATSAGTKYVIIKGISCFGNNIFVDDVSFEQQPTGAPLPVNLISPANNSIDQNMSISLNWFPDGTGPAPTGYRLSLGTNNPPTNVLNNSDIGLVSTYAPTLNASTTYYWQVIPYNVTGVATGCPIWSFTTMAAGLIEVGSGSLVNMSLPVEPYYKYSFSQTIYLQSDLNQPNSQIQSIYYKYNGTDAWAEPMQIYMGQTTRTEFATTTDYLTAAELTQVYNGTLTAPATAGWIQIVLDQPFTYDNVSNLVVCVDMDIPTDHSNSDDFFCSATTTNRSLEQHSDSDASNGSVTSPIAGTLRMDIPDTRFQFVPLSNEPLFAANPPTVTFGSVNLDNTSSPINVQIRNAGGGTLTITQAVTLSGVDAAQFSLTDNNTYPHSLNAGQSITVSLTFTPTGAGVKNAQLNVSDNLVAYKSSSKASLKDNQSDRTIHIIPISGYGNDGVIHTFPYNQGFEDAAFPNLGWTVADGANAANGWRRRTTAENIHNGVAYAVVGTLAGNHWMMSPKFEIGAQSNTLRYWIKDSTDTPDTAATSVGEFLKVLISTTNADSSSFVTQIGNFTNFDIPITYTQQTIDLTPYIGQNIYICFLRHSTGGKFLYMDDLSIANATGIVLNPPTNLTYSVINENNVALNWTAPVPATGTTLNGYKVYRNNLFLHNVAGGTTTTDTDQSVPAGTYTYKVSAVYAEGESGFSDPIGVEITGGNPNELISDSFEFYPDFAQTFGYWTMADVDGQNTYNFANTTYPNLNTPKSFMVFNPNSTTPPLTTLTAHSGNKLLVCFDSQIPPNNDWFITPRIHLGDDSSVNFWAKSFTGQYGLENFKVAISTTDNSPASFTNVISGGTAVSVPAIAWTQYDYDLSAFGGQFIYLAIRCVSNNAFALLINDYKLITTNGTATDDPAPLPSGTALLGNYPNPFNPETIIHYTMKDRGNVLIEIFNTKGQKVTTLENTLREPGHYSVNWSGKDQYGKPVTSGVYFYKMKTGSYSSTKKMILLR